MSNIRRRKFTATSTYHRAALATLPLIGFLTSSNSAYAQIVPNSDRTSTVVDLINNDYDISGGHTSQDGENLFHSFEQFNLDAAQTANFLALPEVKNVIGSVEGGTTSTINGTLQISDSQANLYLINPAGILFGPEAQLNLSGGIVATTANALDFEGKQFVVGESSDYSSFIGLPTSLQFTHEAAGAVANLGNLQADSHQSVSLVGGTVVNTGDIEAPDGTVNILAVEGENLVRLSQQEHLLSLEVSADEAVTGSNIIISPASISEMLTGSSGVFGATALLTDADGTVRLGSTNDAISESGGSVSVSGFLSTAGNLGGYLNVEGKQLSIGTAKLEATGISDRGLIHIDAENIVVTDEVIPTNFETTTYLTSHYVESLSTGSDLDIAASNSFTIEDISDGDLTFEQGASVALTADSDRDGEGTFTMKALIDPSTLENTSEITARGGHIMISGAGITAGAINTDIIASGNTGGGDIALNSSKEIDVYSISSNTYFAGNNAGNGGNVRLEAEDGGITVRNQIKTWSYSDGGNNAGSGGNINLSADDDIVVGRLDTISAAGRNSSGSGGQISIDSAEGSVTIREDIRSSSYAGKNNALTGGGVTITAKDTIDIQGAINTSSTASNQNTGDAGSVSLTADTVLVRQINADSSGRGRDGNISLTGDRIDLLGGDNSVSGGSLWFRPIDRNRDINVGISSDTESTLDISITDLEAVKLAQNVDIGDKESTGSVSLFPENLKAVSDRFPIHIVGGSTLTGSDEDTVWTINGLDEGSIGNISFENIDRLKGGKGKDVFEFGENGSLSGSVVGGDGVDTIDFTDSAATNISFFEIENVFGEQQLEVPEVSETFEETDVQKASSPIIDKSEALERLDVGAQMMANASLLLEGVQQVLASADISSGDNASSESVEADMAKSPQAGMAEELAIADLFDRLETGIGANFREYLGATEEGRKADTVGDVQQKLRAVDATTGTTPALAYAYFVPDAESESAVAVEKDRVAQDNDQLEVMLITQTGEPVRKRQWGITRKQVEEASKTLREQVTSQFSTARQYLTPAQQLYDWIMRPIAAELEERNIESLGFVMDDGLRTLPIAVLHDGNRYLVEDYSLGLLPSFSLTEFKDTDVEKTDLRATRVLAMGASEFENQPDLPAVSVELDIVARQLWQGDAFLNEDFVLENLQDKIEQQNYGIVHLATHASFESENLENSYIQMWDDKLSLSDMRSLGLAQSDVSLIILSACNTALGDRASEYGFAGFAITAGSESALASLWPVSDEGTLGFMSQFYGELKDSSVKAEALRQAQRSLIYREVGINDGLVYGPNNETISHLDDLAESGRWDFSHPFYWSAFTMIGNPW